MIYIVLDNEEKCKELNFELLRLGKVNRKAEDKLRYWLPMIQHPSTGQWALMYEGTERLYISSKYAPDELFLITSLSTRDSQEAQLLLNNKKEDRITAFDLLSSLKLVSMTEEEMIERGWFTSDDVKVEAQSRSLLNKKEIEEKSTKTSLTTDMKNKKIPWWKRLLNWVKNIFK